MATTQQPHPCPAPAVVVLAGEVDLATAGQVRDLLDAAIAGSRAIVVVDASAVTFIDCAGLRELVTAGTRLEAGGRALHLLAPSPALLRLLAWTGLTDAVTTTKTPETTRNT